MKRRKRRPPSKTRVAGFRLELPEDAPPFDEAAVEKALKASPAVTAFDAGRGRFVWLDGPPGKGLREARDAVLRIAPALRPARP